MKTHFHEIPKSNIDRVIELFNALRIIDDSINFLFKDKFYYIGVIYSQLRSLTTDKTTQPLLFHISEIIDDELSFYYMDDDLTEKMPELKDSLLMRLTGYPLSIKKSLPSQIKIKLIDFLKTKPLTYNGQQFRVDTIINHLANESGGAHYSDSTRRYISELSSLQFNNQPLLNNYIVQLAELIMELGINTLKKITDFDVFLNVFLPEITSKKQEYLCDFTFPNSNNRISIFTDQTKIHIQIVDCLGRCYTHRIEEIISPSKLYLINFSHRITTTFKSEIKLFFNELELINVLLDEPLLILNEFDSYNRYFNRSTSKQNENFQFGLSSFLVFGKILNPIERTKIYNNFFNSSISQVTYFKDKNYGYFKSGEEKMKKEGDVQTLEMEDLIKQKTPKQ